MSLISRPSSRIDRAALKDRNVTLEVTVETIEASTETTHLELRTEDSGPVRVTETQIHELSAWLRTRSGL